MRIYINNFNIDVLSSIMKSLTEYFVNVVIGNDEYFWISLFSILNVFICYIIL